MELMLMKHPNKLSNTLQAKVQEATGGIFTVGGRVTLVGAGMAQSFDYKVKIHSHKALQRKYFDFSAKFLLYLKLYQSTK